MHVDASVCAFSCRIGSVALELDPSSFGTHSLRRTKATFARHWRPFARFWRVT